MQLFAEEYLGVALNPRTFSRWSQIGVGKCSKKSKSVSSKRLFDRHSVISTENDSLWSLLLASAQSHRGHLPNCRMIVLRCGLPNPNTKELPALRFILTTTRVEKGSVFVLDAKSVEQCADELEWYIQRHTPANNTVASSTASQGAALWPKGLPYYHGIGERHKELSAPTLRFPYTLLKLQCCEALGGNELEIVAAADIPYATCFCYGGRMYATDDVSEVHGGDRYAFELSRTTTVIGQSLTRYFNHRVNLSPYGNAQFVVVLLATNSDSSIDGASKARLMEGDEDLTVVPCIVTTRDISAGEPLLVGSYGLDYDVKLERETLTGGRIMSVADISSGCGLPEHCAAIREGSIVWCRSPRQIANFLQLCRVAVADPSGKWLQLEQLQPDPAEPLTFGFVSQEACRKVISTTSRVALLLPSLDYVVLPDKRIKLHECAFSRMSPGSNTCEGNKWLLSNDNERFVKFSNALWSIILDSVCEHRPAKKPKIEALLKGIEART